MAEFDARIQGKLDTLLEDYAKIFTTDGHIAIEQDGMLFLSESWLKNYETSQIYKFLTQQKILKHLILDDALRPMIAELITFDEKFTGQENVTAERAMMDFLFNESVYQAFLFVK